LISLNDKKRAVQNEVIASFKKNNYDGFAEVPTGTGKAWILIQMLKTLKPKTCWYLCDSTDNRDITFIKELIKWGAEEWVNKIEFMCYQTACKLKNFKVDLLLADEADFSLTPKYSNVYKNNTFKHRILVSGTISAEKYSVLEKFNLPIVHKLEIDYAEKEGILNKANYYLVNYLLTNAENRKYLGYNRTFARLLNGHYNKKEIEMLQINRKHFLSGLESSVNVARKLMKHLYKQNKNNKILIFCGLSEQANKVCKYTYHSGTDSIHFDMFDRGEIPAVAVVDKVNRGRNINGVNVIIFESPTKSSTKFFQRTGRGRRLDVNDMLNVYFLVPHFKDKFGKIKPTVVFNWIYKAAAKLENFRPITYKF
jgi:superfamily II DNA or RNA helicase